MSWSSTTLSQLPTVLAGPILRKVTATEVSVWLALKSGEDLTLTIYKNNSTADVVQTKTVTPKKLGDHLYVACITAKSATSFLIHGMIYGYNVRNSLSHDFSTPGFLHGGIGAVTFGNTPTYATHGKLPSFLLPAPDFDHLRVLHGSCRKPHGDGIDAFATIHDTYETSLNQQQQTYMRPQMLFLTGDQIYSDDVADQLLFMINSYIGTLFNWSEELPTNPQPEALTPGDRANLVMNTMHFPTKTEASKSHLLKFQEFMLMYIMAWSPSLWGEDPGVLPDFGQLFPNVPQTKTVTTTESMLRLMVTGAHTPTKQVLTDKAKLFNKENVDLASFRSTLPKAARAMANIPTYMIFDDHEITDDWFINYDWTHNALSNTLPRRVIQNGMAAYAICQGWGNTPEQFAAGQPGDTLLNYLETIANSHNNSSYSTFWETLIGNIVLPDEYTDNGFMILRRHPGGLKYHWTYVADNFEVIALDSRTRRSFPATSDPRGKAYIISTEGITEQIKAITSPKKDMTFLIAGSPVYGSGSIEFTIEAMYNSRIPSTADLDYESWGIKEDCRQTLLSALASRASGSEGWAKHRVTILSGDVHYGFTNAIQYLAKNTFQYNLHNVELIIVQCCASSMKNQTTPAGFTEKLLPLTTTSWHRHNAKGFGFRVLNDFVHWGYNNEDGDQLVQITLDVDLFGTTLDKQRITTRPAVIKTNDYYKKLAEAVIDAIDLEATDIVPTTPWDWRIRHFSKKSVETPLKDTYIFSTPVDENTYFHMSSNHEMNYLRGGDAGRYIVGYNQIGDISLRWAQKKLDHRIWWRNFASGETPLSTAFPLSVAVVSLD